jgi:hypothetical protein
MQDRECLSCAAHEEPAYRALLRDRGEHKMWCKSIENSWIERHSRVRLNLSAVHSPPYSTEGVSKLMREPVFNETVQLGIVLRDLEATVRRYVDDYGIGPWDFTQIDAGEW